MTQTTSGTADAAAQTDEDVLVRVQNLKTYYPVRGGLIRHGRGFVQAVDDVSFTIRRGETFGLVGESGCGKSTLGRTILRLEKPRSGSIEYEGVDMASASGRTLRSMRHDVQMVFQDPYGSLDPRFTVRELIGEGLAVQSGLSRSARTERVEQLITRVGMRREHLDRYPHEFSGGQRQRIGIARALAVRPKLLVADEPVSALDVSVQAQVLNLLSDLQEEFGLTYLFIAHDLSVVEYLSDRVGVMYLGKLVELAPAEELYSNPTMPYTQALLSAIPAGRGRPRRERIVVGGDVPSPVDPPSGCRFRTRCWKAQNVCAEQEPALREVSPGHWSACHFAETA
jgi:peptide/nickel transport system ATP-binding protein/oligopeptide transport system ATP-binding protein